jgi:hypothetical protein
MNKPFPTPFSIYQFQSTTTPITQQTTYNKEREKKNKARQLTPSFYRFSLSHTHKKKRAANSQQPASQEDPTAQGTARKKNSGNSNSRLFETCNKTTRFAVA